MPWVYDPHYGGNRIPVRQHEVLRTRAHAFERTRKWFPKCQLNLRFNGHFCYIDVIENGEKNPSPLARLRYFRENGLSMAFYSWSQERYEPCILSNGKWDGTIEEAIETCEPFLSGSF